MCVENFYLFHTVWFLFIFKTANMRVCFLFEANRELNSSREIKVVSLLVSLVWRLFFKGKFKVLAVFGVGG